MQPLTFAKMHGGGNDFILIDNRTQIIRSYEGPELAKRLCRRKFGIGADGLILVEDAHGADFRWRFYNADGSEAEMCGNGGRCAARFAFQAGIAPATLRFETNAGIVEAQVNGSSVKLQLPRPNDLHLDIPLEVLSDTVSVHYINTGVPHCVIFTADIENAAVVEVGRAVRYHDRFQPAGTNVNFVQVLGSHDIAIRTYERGVENETMACGTGSVAGALISSYKQLVESPVKVRTQGGDVLIVHFVQGKNRIDNVFLEGETVFVYSGQLASTS
jgi:diaminopimelate epimerase